MKLQWNNWRWRWWIAKLRLVALTVQCANIETRKNLRYRSTWSAHFFRTCGVMGALPRTNVSRVLRYIFWHFTKLWIHGADGGFMIRKSFLPARFLIFGFRVSVFSVFQNKETLIDRIYFHIKIWFESVILSYKIKEL